MLRNLFFILTILVCTFAFGQDFPERPSPPRLVNDFANILGEREESALEKKLVFYSDSTSTQIVVVTIKSLEGNEIGDYSFRLAEKWGIGQKGKDNGVLILVALADKKMFIATGYGMEGVLPDAIAKRIVENYLKPNFRNNNYYKGIDEATSVIIGLASGQFTPDQIKKRKEVGLSQLLFPLLILIFFIIMSYSRFRNAKNSNLAGSSLNFLTFLLLMSAMSGRGGRGYGNFSSGSGPFGGFGGGGFGGGGAGGSW